MACEGLDSGTTAVEVKPTRHILGLSGGKDSAALAIYLKDQGRDDRIEYFFCDTGAELREVYDYLDRLEDYEKVDERTGRSFTYEDKLSKADRERAQDMRMDWGREARQFLEVIES